MTTTMDHYSMFDYTNDSYTNNTDTLIYSYGERVFVAICWLLITIFGTLGNSLVIVAFLFSRKLQTSTNVFVVSLAVADLLTCLSMIWSEISLLGQNGWPLPKAEWLCLFGGFMIFACGGTSLWHLAVISVNRLFLIILSMPTYQRIYKPCNLAVMVMLVWAIPFSVCMVLPLAGIGGFGYDQQHGTCSDLDHHAQAETFHLAQTAIFYPIPLITVITCYAIIYAHIRRHFKQQRKNEANKPTPSSGSPATSMTETSSANAVHSSMQNLEVVIIKKVRANRLQRIDKMEVDITRNLFLVVCIFFLFLSPYSIALFIPSSDYFLLYGGTIVLANSMINPIIYARRHPHFKVVIGCLIKRKYDAIPEPSGLLQRILHK